MTSTAERMVDHATNVMFSKRTLVVSDCGVDGAELAVTAVAIEFYRKVQVDKAAMVRAVVEDWSQADIVRYLY